MFDNFKASMFVTVLSSAFMVRFYVFVYVSHSTLPNTCLLGSINPHKVSPNTCHKKKKKAENQTRDKIRESS